MTTEHIELGYFGNIWVRQNVMERAGDSHDGHQHYFDHVTLLVKGRVRVEVEDNSPKEFTAPTFMIMRKEKNHKMIALEDDTQYYCVFALRDVDGEIIGDIYGNHNDPCAESAGCVPDGHWDNIEKISRI